MTGEPLMVHGHSYIAVDLGAESGRVMLGSIANNKLVLDQCHRFPNTPIEKDGVLRWDIGGLFNEIKTGIADAIRQSPNPVGGIAVDSWGVDFGLIDDKGRLIENPYHYRDSRTNGMLDKAFAIIPKREIYEKTGLQFMQINSLYQLLAQRLLESNTLDRAKKLLFTADLIGYLLCGRAYSEYSLASTSQMMNMRTGTWAVELFEKLNLPIGIMPEILQPGTVAGPLQAELAGELKCDPIDVIAVGSHDTACAVAAVPAESANWAYISCGTWSLMGVEIPQAIINDKTYDYQFTNEGGVGHTIRLLKNIMGLWLLQESRRQWQREGVELSYAQLAQMAAQAKPFMGVVDPDNSLFLAPGDMPARINQCLQQTGQKPITDKAQLARVILESLAMKYRRVRDYLVDVTGHAIDVIHIVGGGSQNTLLCQLTADATGTKVIAGPVEATASGNILMQALAKGQIQSVKQARQIVRQSFDVIEYQPQNTQAWDKHYRKFYPV
jgi:rhamnulokinase